MPHSSYSFRSCVLVAAVVALVVTPGSSDAQDLPDSEPARGDSLRFRAGQWGAIVAIDGEVAALGLLRFRSPRTAWVLNATAGAVVGDVEVEPPDTEQETENAALGARLGLRRYRPLDRPVTVYSGAGLTGSASVLDVDTSAGDEVSLRMYGAGVYGELGVEYRAARYVAIGVRSLADVTRRWGSETRQVPGGTTLRSSRRELTASIGRLEVLASLYF